jgi:hypothetical protein
MEAQRLNGKQWLESVNVGAKASSFSLGFFFIKMLMSLILFITLVGATLQHQMQEWCYQIATAMLHQRDISANSSSVSINVTYERDLEDYIYESYGEPTLAISFSEKDCYSNVVVDTDRPTYYLCDDQYLFKVNQQTWINRFEKWLFDQFKPRKISLERRRYARYSEKRIMRYVKSLDQKRLLNSIRINMQQI